MNILQDEHKQRLFDKQGFVTIPVLSYQELNELRAIFEAIYNQKATTGMVLGGLNDDISFKKRVSEKINTVIESSLNRIFTDYQVQSSSFIYKVPDKMNEFLPHQDWTMVDEEEYVSVNCWIPLVDITLENGPICVLPGSHYKNLKVHRSHSFGYYFDNYRDTVYDYLLPVTVKAGEAIIINHSLIHYSLPNYSKETRSVCITAIKSKGAPNIMYYKPQDKNMLEVYEMPDDIAYRYSEFAKDKTLLPYGKKINELPFNAHLYSKNEIRLLFKEMLLKSGFCLSEWDIVKLKWQNRFDKLKRKFQ